MNSITKAAAVLAVLLIASNAFAAAKYASIGVTVGNIRSCASAKCAIKFKVWKYTPVEMLSISKDKTWVEVRDFEGFKGWAHKSILSETPGMSAKSDANVRAEPSADAPVAWTVDKGYSFKFLKKQGAWLQVTDDAGTSGWINQSVVWGFTEYKK
ncbi:MAG: SH3 domain-containing protein [Elusimicrobiota bacterium]|jgi:SH3-like domain-containing protein|nr:SH3 domain-containing protein [Elusimicrobiota bacterium]